jgi:hypothetical protein
MVVALAGCGRIGFGLQTGDAVGGDGAGGDAGGSGMITGTGCNSLPFTTIAAAYALGNEETAGQPDVVLLEKPIPCAQLCASSWDDSVPACEAQLGFGPVPNGMQFVRFSFGSTATGTFQVTTAATLGFLDIHATGYITATPSGVATQCGATSGYVSLTSGGQMVPIDGSFMLMGGPTLIGLFHAAWCPSGWYP